MSNNTTSNLADLIDSQKRLEIWKIESKRRERALYYDTMKLAEKVKDELHQIADERLDLAVGKLVYSKENGAGKITEKATHANGYEDYDFVVRFDRLTYDQAFDEDGSRGDRHEPRENPREDVIVITEEEYKSLQENDEKTKEKLKDIIYALDNDFYV
jgi:sarcosine oxidase delta subunit